MSVKERTKDETSTPTEGIGSTTGAGPMDALPATNIVTTNLSEQAYRHIKDLLICGRLKPGTRISFRDAAHALGISVTPLREALLRLAAEQSLVTGRGRTIEVPPLDIARCRELWELRLLLEPFCAEAALPHLTRPLIDLLETVNAQMLAANQNRDVVAVSRFNREFHFRLYGAAQMPMLTWIIEFCLGAGGRLRAAFSRSPCRSAQRHGGPGAACSWNGPRCFAARRRRRPDVRNAPRFDRNAGRDRAASRRSSAGATGTGGEPPGRTPLGNRGSATGGLIAPFRHGAGPRTLAKIEIGQK